MEYRRQRRATAVITATTDCELAQNWEAGKLCNPARLHTLNAVKKSDNTNIREGFSDEFSRFYLRSSLLAIA